MIIIQLKESEEKRILRGHLWVFRNEIASQPDIEDGALTDIFSAQGRFLGRGFWQTKGSIAVRILSRHQKPIDVAFFRKRFTDALSLRERLYPCSRVYRWVHAESDGLPGFTADRYENVIVGKTSCRFYERNRELFAESLLSFADVTGVRLQVQEETYDFGEVPSNVTVKVNGMSFTVDLDHRQKTGMFLDQRENAVAAGRYVQGKRVLDGHCFIGLWSCAAAAAGALEVIGVDTSSSAIELARTNARQNRLDTVCRFVRSDVLEILSSEKPFGAVFLDPPALAKSQSLKEKAIPLYSALSRCAMEALLPGGILVCSSCSHAMDRKGLLEALKRAARTVQRTVKILEIRGAAPDHPVLLSVPETEYLTCVFCQII